MKITIIGYGMQMGPHTLKSAGLGGSETAQLCVAEALAEIGHEVVQIANMPKTFDGMIHKGVMWRSFAVTRDAGFFHQCDLLVVCRRPDLIDPAKFRATKKVLWLQDFATDVYPSRDELYQYDEFWFVSEWQSEQWRNRLQSELGAFHPKPWVTRNGIAPIDMDSTRFSFVEPRVDCQLAFCSRPERGLWELVRPGGIMDKLPSYTLKVCGYDDYPAEHHAFYKMVFGECERHPRVKNLGGLKNSDVRLLLRQSTALVIPTNYAETSCMVAREAIEQLTPVFYTNPKADPVSTQGGGALRETVGLCGMGISPEGHGTDEWAREFAHMVDVVTQSPDMMDTMKWRATERHDLHWPNVARDWTHRARTSLGITL